MGSKGLVSVSRQNQKYCCPPFGGGRTGKKRYSLCGWLLLPVYLNNREGRYRSLISISIRKTPVLLSRVHINIVSISTVLGVAALCLVVLMQMLGVPVSLWEPLAETDDQNGFAMGWTMPSASSIVPKEFFLSYRGEGRHLQRFPVFVRSFFHPPR